MVKRIGDWIWLLFLVMAVYLLVRPGSKASVWITDFGDGMTGLVNLAVTG